MPEKVLIVDDEADFSEALAERLRVKGTQVTVSSSPVSAIQMIKDECFDVVLMDLLMPEMNGIEALEVIKKINSETEVIILSGHISAESGIDAIKLGAGDVVEKMTNLDVLTERISKTRARKILPIKK